MPFVAATCAVDPWGPVVPVPPEPLPVVVVPEVVPDVIPDVVPDVVPVPPEVVILPVAPDVVIALLLPVVCGTGGVTGESLCFL